MRNKYILIGVVVGVLLSSVAVVLAGDIDSPAGPTEAGGQMYTLQQIYDRINDGTAATKMSTFTEPSSGPGSTMHTLDEIYALVGERAPVPKTGQTSCFKSDGTTGTCTCGTANCPSGQDGDLEKGVSWPSPRFTGDGTGVITDHLTGLMWTEDADLSGATRTWYGAIIYCNGLSHGGYTDWRLPNVRELYSLIDFSRTGPALPSGHPFDNVKDYYWSSTTAKVSTSRAWLVSLNYAYVDLDVKTVAYNVWPVRGGQ